MRLTLALLLCLFACASTGIVPTMRSTVRIRQCDVSMVAVSSDLLPDEQLIVEEAVAFWNAQGREQFLFIGSVPWAPNDPEAGGLVVVGYPRDVPVLDAPTCEIGQFNHVAHTQWKANADGCMSKVSVSLLMTLTSLGRERALHTIKHELGHALGLDHAAGPFHLMSPISDCKTPAVQEMTPEDITAYRTLYGQK